ncbi:MAG: hypothetical protein QNJ36_03180 [Calothrix sp. MO_167.B42]|nr:hypothetical protein [Calothrix sp. MO_167.B42]
MAEPAFTDVFGEGATQTETTITIPKANLPGLTAVAENTPESIIAGLCLLLTTTLSTTNQTNNADQQVTVAYSGFPTFVTRNEVRYRQDIYNVNFEAVDTQAGIDPNNY